MQKTSVSNRQRYCFTIGKNSAKSKYRNG